MERFEESTQATGWRLQCVLCLCPSQGCDLEQVSSLPLSPTLGVNEDINISFSWLMVIREGIAQDPAR